MLATFRAVNVDYRSYSQAPLASSQRARIHFVNLTGNTFSILRDLIFIYSARALRVLPICIIQETEACTLGTTAFKTSRNHEVFQGDVDVDCSHPRVIPSIDALVSGVLLASIQARRFDCET
jgi:hypothetical protein